VYPVNSSRRGAAAHHIRSECERFCCETLRSAFLGEGELDLKDSLVLDAQATYDNTHNGGIGVDHYKSIEGGYALNGHSDLHNSTSTTRPTLIKSYLEIYDYVGGSSFRGFVAERNGNRAMFVFFATGGLGSDLKSGLMALLALSSVPNIDCSELVVCLDRSMPAVDRTGLIKDLGWVGFELTTLDEWTDNEEVVSEKWLFLSLET